MLQPTGRYAHHASYINALAQRNGFEILAEETHPIRYQDENPIEGNVYLLQKHSSLMVVGRNRSNSP